MSVNILDKGSACPPWYTWPVLISPERLVRWRVPLGWVFGLTALYLAKPSPVGFAVGIGVAGIGECIRLWASSHLVKNETLATDGPYAWTRNPLYFGSLWLGLGFALATGRWFLIAVVGALFVLVYLPVMRREALRLSQAFPGAYAGYRDSVPLFWPRFPSGKSPGSGSWGRVVSNREHWTVLGYVVVALLLGWKLL